MANETLGGLNRFQNPTFKNLTVTGTLTAGSIGSGGDIVLGNGESIKTDTVTAHTATFQAYDVNGAAYKDFATLTNGDTPSFAIAAPSGGTVTIDGATIGGTTPAAGTFTTVVAGTTVTATTNLVSTAYHLRSVGNGLTAAGTNRATALQLAKAVNNVTTTASGTGVVLPAGQIGMEIYVYNNGAETLAVYALASETINGTAGSTGVTQATTKVAVYHFTAANTWISVALN